MVHQLIVTSAKQGLEGGSGDQAVLRSAGMPPQVASRLKAAGGYSHPFPHGDRRNPVVYVHRIEEAAGKTWHVLGCIRDVGSDHTGRSNFLAHMLAADQADVRGKKAGPAAVMASSDLFRHSWSGPPDGAAPAKTLIAKDEPPQSGSCDAWTKAGLDPGLAGDLAGNAAAGKPVVLVTRPGDDVLALFRDALRLVQPEKRWSVTFNTCAIESFNGIWTAIRDDLPQARGLRDSRGAVVIDLTKTPRGSDDPYARFARGEAETLPWQAGAKATSAGAAAAEAVLDAGPAAGPGKPPTLPPGTASGRRWGADRDSRPIFIPPPATERPRARWVALVVVLVLVLAGLPAYVFRDEIRNLVLSKPTPDDDLKSAPPLDMPVGPTPEEMAREDALKQKQAIEAARRKLAAAGGGRTDEIRAAAEKLEEEVAALRQGTDTEPGLRLRPDGGGDPQDATQRAIAAANRADELGQLSDDAPSLVADLEAATTELAAAVGMLDAAKQQVPALAAAERQARKGKMEQDQANELANRQRDAFAAFAKEASLVAELPARDGVDVAGVGPIKRSKPEVDLGPFPVQDLVDPSLKLAVPEETINGTPFEAEIVLVEDNRWEIRSTQRHPDVGSKPQKFAGLVVVDGLLRLEVEPKLLDKRPVAILRRCVILIEARDPETKLLKVREIRLVKPTKVGLLQVAAAGGPQQMQIPVPVGIFSKDTPPGVTTAADLALPVSGIEITGQWGGSEKMTKRLPKEAAAADQPGIVTWPNVRVSEIANGVTLELKVAVSLLGATLTVTPTLAGPNSAGINLERLVEFLDKRAPKLSDENKDFKSRIEKCPGKDFKKAQGSKTDSDGVKSWFMRPLATFGQMGLALPKHETIQSSMNEYFSAQYRRLAEEKRVAWERDIASQQDEKKREEMKKRPVPTPDFPNSFDDWTKRCSTAKEPEWNKEFTDRLMAWSVWFWPLFETHWKTTETMAQQATDPVDLRLLEIVSVARDADGKEYRVPLVEFDAAAPVTRSESFPGAKAAGDVGTAAGTGSTVTPSRGTGL